MKSQLNRVSKFVLAEEDVESILKDSDTIAYYNPGGMKNDKHLRAIATRNRVITFTEKESL